MAYYCDRLSEQETKVWKKPSEERASQLGRTRPSEKIILVIFWNKSGILLSEYLSRGTTISSPYYASVIERLRHCAIVEKRVGKVSDRMLLLHDNAPIDKCNIVQAARGKTAFDELTHHAYSADVAPPNCQT